MTQPSWNDQDDRTSATRATENVRVAPASDQHTGANPELVRQRSTTRASLDDRNLEGTDAADRSRGIQWGAAFFGWLAATGVAVLLIALVAATGTAIGMTESNVEAVVDGAVGNAGAVSLGGVIALVLVLAISYLAGGYVAARMASSTGRSQGFAVWVVGLIVTVLAALGGIVLGSAYDVLGRLDLPRIPVDEGTATTAAVLTLATILLVTLLAALIGGALGDRYRRRLDAIDVR